MKNHCPLHLNFQVFSSKQIGTNLLNTICTLVSIFTPISSTTLRKAITYTYLFFFLKKKKYLPESAYQSFELFFSPFPSFRRFILFYLHLLPVSSFLPSSSLKFPRYCLKQFQVEPHIFIMFLFLPLNSH